MLALARREIDGEVPPETAADAEADMEFLGLVGMADPVRPEVPDAIARCRQAGIRVVMVTGDHPATAAAVAARGGAGRTAAPSSAPNSPARRRRPRRACWARSISVLARVAPEEKLRIARALQARGEVVAMTGDGVNDAPALRQADIGVAMGKVRNRCRP